MSGDPAAAATSPVVLGIDPGIRVCGWGLIRGDSTPRLIAGGVIRPRPSESFARRLLFLYTGLTGVIEAHQPDEVAIEDPFVGALAPASALTLGQARGAAVLAAAQAGVEVAFYAPKAVKAAIGYGGSDKRQVQTMVRLILRLEADPEPADAADALAVALCHLGQRRVIALQKATPA
jgi:crossover junction endodeoxyribonuclease RuvC